MKKLRTEEGGKNLIYDRLIEIRRRLKLSQRDLATELQLSDYDMDKNVITRIETNSRYVSDFELKALSEVLDISYSYLIDGVATKEDKEHYPEL